MNLEKKIAVVTGGGSGIGLQTAIDLKKRGATVIILGRTEEKLKKAADEHGFDYKQVDVSNEDEVIKFYDYLKEKHGTLDILINNAGYGYSSPLDEIELDKFLAMYGTNVIGAMLMAREAAKLFKKQNSGNIVNISSTSGLKGGKNSTAYSSSKFALKGMTECWRAELRPHNVRVILVNPSEVQTPFFENSGYGEREFNETKLQATEISHPIVAALEMEDRGFITELTVFATNPRD